ncbi:MAG TPA: PadR family transcriptional regulator [Candidatus Limnocylindrales bacterium]|nr:PadR family transcriptional regulator [Candidatus Limnocylindrales bacterium]
MRRQLRQLSPAGGRFFGPGELRLALLALLADTPGHGYDLMTRLEARFDGAYQASAGAIYPTLQQLEDERLVRLAPNEERKVYQLSQAGQAEVGARAQEIERIWARAASRGEWAPLRDPHAAEIVGPALRLVKAAVKAIVKAHGDSVVVEQVQAILAESRRRIEQLDTSTRRSRR